MAWKASPEEREDILRSLLDRGPKKIVGFLPSQTVFGTMGMTYHQMEVEAGLRGFAAVQLSSKECCIKGGAIYVYDRDRLRQLLRGEAELLAANNWPLDSDTFVRAIAANWLESDDPILPVIRRAFGDEAAA
jgi:hypothetical protein